MTSAFKAIDACRLCGCAQLDEYMDFGSVPLGNNLQSRREAALAADSYPLNLMRCTDCGHFQLGVSVDPKLLYATNYTYLSGIGASFVRHFAAYAPWAIERCALPKGSLVVDVGSNDGTCLKAFQSHGMQVCGVDPASLAARIANENGVDTINAFFDADAVAQIKSRHGQADLVTSHNVLAHIDDLAGTFRNIHALLKDGGYFCFEIGYFREVLKSGNFDTIYHEHLDYHHAAPLVRHLTGIGFQVIDLSVNEVQGGSLRLLLRKSSDKALPRAVVAFLDEERSSVLYDEAFLIGWRDKIEKTMGAFRALVRSRIEQGKSVVGYGAPTKATLLMKMAGIGAGDIARVVEDNRHKVGLFMPGTGVPIVASSELDAAPFDVLVLFAWNFAEDIVGKLKGRLSHPIEAIIPLPELRMVTIQ